MTKMITKLSITLLLIITALINVTANAKVLDKRNLFTFNLGNKQAKITKKSKLPIPPKDNPAPRQAESGSARLKEQKAANKKLNLKKTKKIFIKKQRKVIFNQNPTQQTKTTSSEQNKI
jgi:hypothetical protein